MTKDAYWFRHDSNARNDSKLMKLRRIAGLEGVGLYWCVVEMLREANAYQLPEGARDDICFDMRVDPGVFDTLIDCELLTISEGVIYSESLIARMQSWEAKREKLKENGRKGGLAKAKQLPSKPVAKPKQKSSDKRRVEKSRLEKSIGDGKDSGTSVPVDPGKALVPPKKKKVKEKGRGVPVWNAYLESYALRYGAEPVRDQTANTMCAKMFDILGKEEAPLVAAYYVTSNYQYYTQRGHNLTTMVADASKLRTEWATGRRATQSSAREADKMDKESQEWMQLADSQGRKQDGTGNN